MRSRALVLRYLAGGGVGEQGVGGKWSSIRGNAAEVGVNFRNRRMIYLVL